MGKIKQMLSDDYDDFQDYRYEMEQVQEELFFESTISDVVALMLTYGYNSVSESIRKRYEQAMEALEETC